MTDSVLTITIIIDTITANTSNTIAIIITTLSQLCMCACVLRDREGKQIICIY